MRLQSLELHGFKSFPERTKITFDAGMTVIVGPNGSGKSNISDAVKWVLGELSAKNIRGVKLEDVIFGGTDKRSPMGFAEVSLTIDNTGDFRIQSDYNEITVTRRYFRTGESEYYINGQARRLRDIVDLFMNTGVGKTGYSIIGQGKISEIIAQRSEDRRYIFEEAAGISKFRHKKQEAERKLAEVENNLLRVSDIVAVLEQRVGPLEKEAAKAKIYLELFDRKKELDITLAIYDIENIANQSDEFEKSFIMAKHALDMVNDTIASLESQTASLYEKQDENRLKLQEATDALTARNRERAEIVTNRLLAEKELEHGNTELLRYQRELDRQNAILAEAEETLAALKQSLKKALHKQKELNEAYEAAYAELNELRTVATDLARELSQTQSDKAACEKLLIDSKIRLSALESSHASLSDRLSSVTEELTNAKEILAKSEKKLAACDEQLASYRNDASQTQAQKEELSRECDAIEKEIATLINQRNATNVSMTAKREQAATLQRMEDHFDGYQKSVRFVLDNAAHGKLQGICGPISKLIQVDAAYSVAIETALGNNIQNIVTEDEAAAKAAIAALKRENAGRATFYPLSSVRGDNPKIDLNKAKSFDGYIGIASELLRYDARYADVMSSMLGRTFVFDTLDHATAMARHFGYTTRIVTLDGQLINAGGSYTGGSAKRDSGILSRARDIEALTSEAAALEAKATEIGQAIENKERKLAETRDSLESLNDNYMLLAAMYRAEETSRSLLVSQIATERNAVETLESSLQHIRNQDESSEKLEKSLNQDIEDLIQKIKALDERLITIEDEIKANEASLNAKNDERSDSLLAITVAGKEVEAAQLAHDTCLENIERITNARDEVLAASEACQSSFTNLQNNIETLAETLATLDAAIASLEEEIGKLRRDSLEFESRARELHEKIRQKTEEKNVYALQHAKLEAKRQGLINERDKLTARLWDEYDLTFTAACELGYPPITPETRAKSVTEQNKLRLKIRDLGAVNVNAIEEYANVKSEYDTMSTQIEDLNKSKNDYSDIVTQMEQEMCQRFTSTFNQINENFMSVFRELFGGGSARLELTDPHNVLTSGIEIIVSPPGKVIKNLKSLSGGEQVFVAIAILFAIFKINPPPFCLLDEIESALDEVNVSRFANYAKNFCNNTQFIVISHRRGTMEAASALYGVTMQERGVSKLLSINVSEVEKQIGIKAE